MTLPAELMELIQQGEGLTVEFKKSMTDITKDVYDTVCSSSNRDGGHIFLGVKDNGTILGIQADRVEQMKKNFVTTINNDSKMYPPLYLTPEQYEVDGHGISFSMCMFRSERPFTAMREEFMTVIMNPI